MKKIKKFVLAFALIFAFVLSDIAIAPFTAQAAGLPKVMKSLVLMKGDGENGEMGYGIINFVRSDKVTNLKSSNPKVLKVSGSVMEEYGDYNISVYAKKTGTSTVSVTVKRKNGKVYRLKTKVSVYNYANPLSKCTLGKTDYTKKFNKASKVDIRSNKKEKINVVAKKGYKITGLYYSEYGTGKQKKIKNGSKVKLDSMHYLQIIYKNVSKNYTYTLYLKGKE